MGIGKKITKGIIGSGVNLSHKAPPMSGEAGRLLNNMPLLKNNSGPGNYGGLQVEKSGIVSKGFMKAKQSYGTKKMGQYGPEKALIGKQKNLPEFLKKEIEAVPEKSAKKKKGMKQMGEMEEAPMSGGMGKYGKHKGPKMVKSPRQEKIAEEKGDMDEVVVTAPKLTNRQAKTRKKAREATDTVQKEKLNKRQKRQEGRAERKKIRKAGLSRGEKRKQIIESRKKQKK